MQDGFIRIAAASPDLRVADTRYNARQIVCVTRAAAEAGAQLLVLPELCLTGYTPADLFFQDALLKGALEGLEAILEAGKDHDMLVVVGLPVARDNRLYNCGAVLKGGRLLGLVPETRVPNHSELYELRHFAPGPDAPETLRVLG